jgi:hypothetical protein
LSASSRGPDGSSLHVHGSGRVGFDSDTALDLRVPLNYKDTYSFKAR